jgi:hypothetical protein
MDDGAISLTSTSCAPLQSSACNITNYSISKQHKKKFLTWFIVGIVNQQNDLQVKILFTSATKVSKNIKATQIEQTKKLVALSWHIRGFRIRIK